MKVVNLFEAGEKAAQPQENVAIAIKRIADEKSRVYRTHAWSGHHESNSGFLNFTFVTTIKDIHLGLGRFNLVELIDLGHVIDKSFEAEDVHILARVTKGSTDSLLITRTKTGVDVIFTLSAAR